MASPLWICNNWYIRRIHIEINSLMIFLFVFKVFFFFSFISVHKLRLYPKHHLPRDAEAEKEKVKFYLLSEGQGEKLNFKNCKWLLIRSVDNILCEMFSEWNSVCVYTIKLNLDWHKARRIGNPVRTELINSDLLA